MIFGVDWLYTYYVSINCRAWTVKFQFSNEPVLEWKGDSLTPKKKFISYIKAKKLISKDCIYHLVRVKSNDVDSPTIESVPIMNEFPEDLPGVPHNREIDFGIDVLFDT